MKAIWQGTLSFGLINIPVSLYSAIESHALGFTLLHEKCHTPISYKRWCNHCNKEVEWSNVVKGLEIKKDTYFILTQENLHKLKPLKTEAISLLGFIDPALISPIYLDKHYFLAPKKSGEKSFFLFIQALNESHKIAVGDFVMKEKEHVCIISAYESGLLLTTLNYSYEIRDIHNIETLKKAPAIKSEELKLAVSIVNQLSKKKLDITSFKDTFAERLMAVLKKKGTVKKLPAQEKTKKVTSDSSLISALKASLKKPATKKNAKKKK